MGRADPKRLRVRVVAAAGSVFARASRIASGRTGPRSAPSPLVTASFGVSKMFRSKTAPLVDTWEGAGRLRRRGRSDGEADPTAKPIRRRSRSDGEADPTAKPIRRRSRSDGEADPTASDARSASDSAAATTRTRNGN